MNVGKLKRVAIKEFKRSPAKTGFLLAVLPVAFYFCVPLLLRVLKKPSPSTAAAAPASASFVLPAVTNAVIPPSRVGRSWDEVLRALEKDSLAMPAGISANARNPFAAVKPVKIDTAPVLAADGEEGEVGTGGEGLEDESTSANPVERTADASNPIRALGLRLTATVVGQRSRFATINDKTYEEGEPIRVTIGSGEIADAEASPILTRVDRRFVVVSLDGHEHRLQLPEEPRDAIVVKTLHE